MNNISIDEFKCNHKNAQLNLDNIKKWKRKGKKYRTTSKMEDFNPAISKITLNGNCLNIPDAKI